MIDGSIPQFDTFQVGNVCPHDRFSNQNKIERIGDIILKVLSSCLNEFTGRLLITVSHQDQHPSSSFRKPLAFYLWAFCSICGIPQDRTPTICYGDRGCYQYTQA